MIDLQIPKIPYLKGKGFMDKLCPIIKKGIPREADSAYDKRVIGTAAHTSFWENEIHKIKNGVICPGIGWVPGRFYYYINYKRMSTIRGVITPDMIDLHLELAYLIEFAKANHHNILIPKGRRKGISEAAHTLIIDYGFRFSYGYKAGVASGKKTYVDDFISKWRFADSNLPPELSVKKLVDNDDEIVAGYSIKNDLNTFEDKGTYNTIYARTMHTNPNMFKGLYLNDVISEELGEHEHWFEFFSATKDCLMNGSVQEGTFTAFGTGGSVDKGSKDFKRISYEADKFNFIEFIIPATRFYYYGGATEVNRRLPIESELFKKYKDYQLIGVEDTLLAEKHILERRDKLLKSGNLKEYNEDLQNNPLNKAEIFKKSVVNNFNINKLNEQQYAIDSLKSKKYSKYKLEFVKSDEGAIKMPLEVKCLPAKDHDEESECILIIDSEHPKKSHKNLYVSGIDSYDQDTSRTSKSLGAMCVLIRENSIAGALKKVPVAVIRTRPKRKEKFYEMCLMLSVYYNIQANVLIDVRNPGIIQYFKDRGADKYLAQRPAKFESANSEQGHDFGVSLNTYSKPMMVSLMQTNIEDYSEGIWFPDLITELGNYDEVEIGSDNDLADAYGMALMQDVSAEVKPKEYSDGLDDKRFELPFFTMDGHSAITDISKLKTNEQDHLLFGKG
jgi:hypothetical protein